MKVCSVKSYPKKVHFSKRNPILRGMLIHDHSEPLSPCNVMYIRQDEVRRMINKAVKEALQERRTA